MFPGITEQPTLVPTPVNLDDPTSTGAEPDTDIIFSGARMIAGHAFLTGDNPTPIPVVKSWQNIDQNWCLVESVPLSLIQNALGQLPPATASLNPPNNGGANTGGARHGSTELAEVSVRAAPGPASIAQNGSVSQGAAPIQASLGSPIVNPLSQIERLGRSLALPKRPSSIANRQSKIQILSSLPTGPALVWDYVIVNSHVMDFVFGPRTTGLGAQETETGFAAVGFSSTDVWNKCATNNTTYTSLLWSDNTSSATSITVSNAPNNYGNPVSDVMYSGYACITTSAASSP